MALIQGETGRRGATAYSTHDAGVVMASVFTIDLATQAIAAVGTDVIEIGFLPAYTRPISVALIGEITQAALTANVALLSGEVGAPESARTMLTGANVLLTNAAIATAGAEVAATRLACASVPVTDFGRGWGVTLSAAVAAGAGKKLHLLVEYSYV